MAENRIETRAGAASRRRRFEEKDGGLIPGLPDEISIDLIVAKHSSWKDICTLSCVSRGWHRAVVSRQVHRARVRSQSGEEFTPDWINGHICIRAGDNSWNYRLPPIPGLDSHPIGCQIVPLDGRIYVIGGLAMNRSFRYFDNVYVLDLAGQKPWKRCASMKQPRACFEINELDGKIVVFGGKLRTARGYEPAYGAEMYDPEKNDWESVEAEMYDPEKKTWKSVEAGSSSRGLS